jgi:hypothetical protein
MNDLFKLLDQPDAASGGLYGRSVDNYVYSFLSKQKDGIPYQMAIGSASTLTMNRPFLYKGGDPQILDTNAAPTAISLEQLTLYENAANAVVGTLTVTDNDKDDTYTLALAGADANVFDLKDHTLQLKSGVSADYETQSSYSVTVTATDFGGLSKSQQFTIQVTDVDETTSNEPDVVEIPQNTAPTNISLSNDSITENTPLALVGSLSVTDPDTDDTHTLTLSGYHDWLFEVSNNQLKLRSGVSADYETQSSYSVTVTATDSGGLSKSQQFTIQVTDVDETTSTDNGDSSTYGGKNTDSGDTTTPTTQNTLYGTVGNDMLDGFSGYDIIDGKEGLDTVKYSVASTEVSFSENDSGQLVIQNSANASLYTGKNASGVESDTLVSMERIQFSDKNYALDLDGNAGVAAKAVITCFGQDSLDLYMSSALTLADGGSTLDEICELVASPHISSG